MSCLRRLIYSVFVFCAFLFTSCFFSSPSYATSQSFSYDSVNNPVVNAQYWNIDNIGFNPIVVSISGTLSNFSNNGFPNTIFTLRVGSSTLSSMVYVHNSTFSFLYEYPDMSSSGMNNVLSVNTYYLGSTYSFTITFYDSLESFKECSCPIPDPCPDFPENPYDDKLDSLIKAVYFVPAVLLAIYFFYIMYSWYLRS